MLVRITWFQVRTQKRSLYLHAWLQSKRTKMCMVSTHVYLSNFTPAISNLQMNISHWLSWIHNFAFHIESDSPFDLSIINMTLDIYRIKYEFRSWNLYINFDATFRFWFHAYCHTWSSLWISSFPQRIDWLRWTFPGMMDWISFPQY